MNHNLEWPSGSKVDMLNFGAELMLIYEQVLSDKPNKHRTQNTLDLLIDEKQKKS